VLLGGLVLRRGLRVPGRETGIASVARFSRVRHHLLH
jgi:hypothetical protein